MSKTKILEWFNTNNNALDTNHIILYMLAALFISIIIYITYRITYTGVSYNNKFAITNLIILLIATVLMMMILSRWLSFIFILFTKSPTIFLAAK